MVSSACHYATMIFDYYTLKASETREHYSISSTFAAFSFAVKFEPSSVSQWNLRLWIPVGLVAM